MPTYEYQCPEGHRFEVFQKMSDDPVASCPECGAAAQRLISGGVGFLFRGEGFYITDYRSEDYKKKASREAGSGDSGGGAGGDSGTAASGSGGSSGQDSSKEKGSSRTGGASKPASDS